MDPLEKDRLRQKMATRMGVFLEQAAKIECVSAHCADDPIPCELCQRVHAVEFAVVKNRSGKKMKASISCLTEMVRFQVCDISELPRWLKKLPAIKAEAGRRREEQAAQRERERRRLERKVIVRKRAER